MPTHAANTKNTGPPRPLPAHLSCVQDHRDPEKNAIDNARGECWYVSIGGIDVGDFGIAAHGQLALVNHGGLRCQWKIRLW